MTVNDAYKLIKQNEPDKKVTECYESNNYYVFTLIPINGNPDKLYFDCTYGVNKKDESIIAFSPVSVDKEEMASMKPISFIDSNGNKIETKSKVNDSIGSLLGNAKI